MEYVTSDFSVILMRDNGPQLLPVGNATGILHNNPDFDGCYLPLICGNCGQVQFTYGDIVHVSTNNRSMGRERLHDSHHLTNCTNCEYELNARVEFMEYPRGAFQPYQIELIGDVDYYAVPGLKHILNDVRSKIRRSRDLRSEISDLRDLVDSQKSGFENTAFAKFIEGIEELTSVIKDVVIVLGSHGGDSEEDLEAIKELLNDRGYDPYLIKDLPEFEDKSLESNIRIFVGMARFCVMLDSEPSGHIKEYEIAKDERSILVMLTPDDGGSTWMIGDDEWSELNFIKTFEYSDSPSDSIDAAIEWAENYHEERSESYEEYPWRD